MTGFCKYGNKPSGFIKARNFLVNLKTVKYSQDYAPWGCIILASVIGYGLDNQNSIPGRRSDPFSLPPDPDGI
jgi:hypothetical protein